jgi:hypothetical protein
MLKLIFYKTRSNGHAIVMLGFPANSNPTARKSLQEMMSAPESPGSLKGRSPSLLIAICSSKYTVWPPYLIGNSLVSVVRTWPVVTPVALADASRSDPQHTPSQLS